jgi:hypothetical protein
MPLPAKIAMAWLLAALPTAFAQSDLGPARTGLSEFGDVCAKEDSQLWRTSLCGRIVLVDPRTRRALSNARDPENQFTERDGVFEGTLPGRFLLANTSIRWGTEDWAMVLLPLPVDRYSRVRLLTHESFHRIQKGLGLEASDQANSHLDTESGRIWLRLELRALAQALRLEGQAGRAATNDALLFRAARRNLNPGSDANENALEIQEGLAEYTGTVVALKFSGESVNRVARAVEAFEDQSSYSRSFAYATGPALGLLLDRYDENWRRVLKANTDISGLLAKAVDSTPEANVVAQARKRAAAYGYSAVAEDEQARDRRRKQQLAAFQSRFIDGATLRFPRTAELQRSFNPNNLVTMGDSGTVYPTGTFTSRWGRLEVDDVGALLAPDNQSLRVSAPADVSARPLAGPGWKLELAEGWTVRKVPQTTSFEVVPAGQ